MDHATSHHMEHPTFHHAHQKPEVYDPAMSTTSPAAMQDWLNAPVLEDIKQVPGIGQKHADALASSTTGYPVTSTFQLLGMFLLCRGYGVNSVDHCNKFHEMLRARGVHSHVNSVVLACANKCNIMFPGIYDGESTFEMKPTLTNLSFLRISRRDCLQRKCLRSPWSFIQSWILVLRCEFGLLKVWGSLHGVCCASRAVEIRGNCSILVWWYSRDIFLLLSLGF